MLLNNAWFQQRKSLMAEKLEQASQWHGMYYHDLEVMSSNPGWVEIGVHSTFVISRTWTKKYSTSYRHALANSSLWSPVQTLELNVNWTVSLVIVDCHCNLLQGFAQVWMGFNITFITLFSLSIHGCLLLLGAFDFSNLLTSSALWNKTFKSNVTFMLLSVLI